MKGRHRESWSDRSRETPKIHKTTDKHSEREREREKNEKDKDRVDRDIVHKWNEHIKQLTMRKSFS